MSGEQWPCPPLPVRIQSIDLSNLDFQSGTGTSKLRHITFVEATNLFLFVGSSSGTVYIFSRDILNFLLMIPFKGGKVCNISVTLDESEVAVASIRGKVSIYRLYPNLRLMQCQSQKSQSRNQSESLRRENLGLTNFSKLPGEAFKHLYDVSHHLNNEITEMLWSPNGKYLFVGDSQGLISQIDVASLEEFPRPPPSRIILKLESRILQIDCIFPFLAVCTIDATFLCDLEKEDFTRIQTLNTKCDVKAAGVSLVLVSNNSDTKFKKSDSKMTLLVSEVSSGYFYQCGMDGSVLSYEKVELAPGIISSVVLFDPKIQFDTSSSFKRNNFEEEELNFSPGKMFNTDDGYLVSVSSNRISIFDPRRSNCTNKVILWTEDFNRINSFKIIANYGFVWYGNKFDVFALTPFRSYGKQLLMAGLESVLQSWIRYATSCVGWEWQDKIEKNWNKQEKSNDTGTAIQLFRQMMFPIEEEDNFCDFVAGHVPFKLVDKGIVEVIEENYETFDMKLTKLVQKLINGKNSDTNVFIEIISSLKDFYTNLGATVPQLNTYCKKSDLTLAKVINSAHAFVRQPQLVNLKEDLSRNNLKDKIFNFVVNPLLQTLSLQTQLLMVSENPPDSDPLQSILNDFLIHKYANCPLVLQHFKDLGIPPETLFYDAFLADTILLLLPIISDKLLYKEIEKCLSGTESNDFANLFFSWVILITFVSEKVHCLPYSSLLRPLQNQEFFEKLAEEILSSIYRDVVFSLPVQSSDALPQSPKNTQQTQHNQINYFLHFLTFTILFSKVPKSSSKNAKSAVTKFYTANLLLSLFPLKRNVKKDIIDKIVQICTINPNLLKLYHKACLEDGKSMKLCGCGIQSCYGNLEKVPTFQRGIEEAILQILVDNHLELETESGLNVPNERTTNQFQSQVHLFAVKRCLIQPYLETLVADEILSDRVKIGMILRSGVCAGLKSLKFNLENLKMIREGVKKYDSKSEFSKEGLDSPDSLESMESLESPEFRRLEKNCSNCRKELTLILDEFKPISMDCVGVWIVQNVVNLDKFMQIVRSMCLNSRGEFSLRFYRYLIKRDELRRTKKEDSGFGDLVSLSNLTCSVFH